jgi:hypothetical protein
VASRTGLDANFGFRTDFGGPGSSLVTCSQVGTTGRGTGHRCRAEKACGGSASAVLVRWWRLASVSRHQGNPRRDARGPKGGDSQPPGRSTSTPTACRQGSEVRVAIRQERKLKDLEGDQSPWEERAAHGWKRPWADTDSSAEQSPEVGCPTAAALTTNTGNGVRRRRHPCGGTATARGQRSQ